MPGAYSADLRERVVGAVNAGTSRRGASAVFNVSVSTAIRWAQRFEETGGWQAKPTGGDRRSQAIEAHKVWLLALVATEPDLTLTEIRGRLAADKTFAASVSALWRFFDRHGISLKKRCTPPNRTAKTSKQLVRNGERSSPRSTQGDWFSSMKPAPART
jgi:transposase